MQELGQIWQALVNSLGWCLIYLKDLFVGWGLPGSWGLAIVAFTLLVRLVMLPLSIQQIKTTKAQQKLQPELEALRRQYGKDRQKMAEEQMKLYKQHGINPLAGCLPMLLQMPIWFALYRALYGLAGQMSEEPFLGMDLGNTLDWHSPLHWILPLFTMVSQYVTQKMMTPTTGDPQQQTMTRMMQFMPLMFGYFAFVVPAGLTLYWAASNVFTLIQQGFTTGWGSLPLLGRGAVVKGPTGKPLPAAGSQTGSPASPVSPLDSPGEQEGQPSKKRRRPGRKRHKRK